MVDFVRLAFTRGAIYALLDDERGLEPVPCSESTSESLRALGFASPSRNDLLDRNSCGQQRIL